MKAKIINIHNTNEVIEIISERTNNYIKDYIKHHPRKFKKALAMTSFEEKPVYRFK